MPENSETSAATDAPPCEKCGAVTFATSRTMRTHDLDVASAIARDRKVPVWRCMRCTNEVAREA